MAEKKFSFTLRTPEAEVISQEVHSLKVRTEDGPLVILPLHASLTGTIVFSRLVLQSGTEEKEYLVRQGLLSISLERRSVRILCLSCEELRDVSYATAKEYLNFLEEKLKIGENLEQIQVKYLKNEKIAIIHQLKELERTEQKTP